MRESVDRSGGRWEIEQVLWMDWSQNLETEAIKGGLGGKEDGTWD